MAEAVTSFLMVVADLVDEVLVIGGSFGSDCVLVLRRDSRVVLNGSSKPLMRRDRRGPICKRSGAGVRLNTCPRRLDSPAW